MREPMIQTVKASEAKQKWSQLLNAVFRREARVIVEKTGVPVAALIAADDLERLAQYEKAEAERFAALRRIGEAFKDVPVEELEEEVEQALSLARQRRRGGAREPGAG